jgi:hypothetical protein
MRNLWRPCVLALALVVVSAGLASAQTDAEKAAARVRTRDQLATLLVGSGPKTGIDLSFKRSEKNEFNFVAMKTTGLKNAESMEVVISVTNDATIGFRAYPHFAGGYVNIDKARNSLGLLRQMALLTHKNFLFWGADETGDIFAGYTITLESGFPDKAIDIVLYSIKPLDGYFGELRPNIDGSAAAK